MQETIEKFRALTETDADLETVDGVLSALRAWFLSNLQRLGDDNLKSFLHDIEVDASGYVNGTWTVDEFRRQLMIGCLGAHETAVESGHWDNPGPERSRAKRLGW